MATVSSKLITAEEFFRMPQPADGSQQELVRGGIITMPPPGARHGGCCFNLSVQIGVFLKQHQLGKATCNDAGFISERDPDTVRAPDLAFWSHERLPELPEGYVDIPPDLVAEVISPSDRFPRLQRKVSQYLDRGVRLVWVLDPDDRSMAIFRPGQQAVVLEENDTLTGGDVLPGFQCPVKDLFA